MFLQILASVAALSLAPASAPAIADPQLHAVEQAVIQRMNAERTKNGLRALVTDMWLVRSARRHTAWMANNHNLIHTTAAVGENIAMGQTTSPEVVRDWMNSPGHRANILNGGYTRVGAAAYSAPDGTIYWCLQFLN